jgi:signal transduction histidine kinase
MATLRLPRVDVFTVDKVIAVLLSAGWLLQVVFLGHHLQPDRYSAGFVGLVACVGFAWRRDHAALVGVGTQALMVVSGAVGHLLAGPITIAWFGALYALVVWTSRTWFVAGLVFFVISDMVPTLWTGGAGEIANFTAAIALVMLFLRVIVGGRDRRLQLAQRERDLAAREAVMDERTRIARELHDVIAHHVSTMVVQAGAQRRLLDPSQADTGQVLGSIENLGRSALTEMRRMVTILRQDRAEGLAPQPTINDVPVLVDQMQRAGLAVELRESGRRRELPVGVQLSAYRIIQEALTNALKYAGEDAHVLVSVAYSADGLELGVRDDGPGVAQPGEGGHGLVGMRERVAMLGGRLETGLQPGGGFGVRVQLPVNGSR